MNRIQKILTLVSGKAHKLDRFIAMLTFAQGAVGRGPLNDVLVSDRNSSRGPWSGGNAVQVFQDAGYIDIDGTIPILFAHDDLVPCNILVTDGPDPRVAAIID